MTDPVLTADKQRPSHLFKPGQSGNPAGRPRGSRGKLSEDFLLDLHSAWTEHGADALARCAKTEPGVFCKIVASLLPRNVDVNVSGSIDVGTFAARFRNAVELLHNKPELKMKTIEHADARRLRR